MKLIRQPSNADMAPGSQGTLVTLRLQFSVTKLRLCGGVWP